MAESTQHKLSRNRPPRVHITYDVHTGGAIEKKELPFVVGILSDLAGKPENPLPAVKDRKFVNIDKDNFNDVMTGIGPGLALQVPDISSNEDAKLNVLLQFKTIDDFNPINVVKQVNALNTLFEARQRLTDLLAKLDGNDELDTLLQEILGNTDHMNTLKTIIGGNGNGE